MRLTPFSLQDDDDGGKLSTPRNPAKRKKKRHNFDSSSEAEEEEDEGDRNFVADPNAVEAACSSTVKKTTSSTNGHVVIDITDDSDVQVVESTDPWEHLDEYMARLTQEFPDLDPLVTFPLFYCVD